MMSTKKIFALGLVTTLLISCYRSPNDSVANADLDMVTTNYTNTNYLDTNLYKTFTIADSFGLASNVEDVSPEDVNDPAFRNEIKKYLKRNMEAYGYRWIDHPDKWDTSVVDTPNIYISVMITYINTKGVSYVPIYGGYPSYGWGWGGYPSYGWGGYSYYYPTYIPSYYSYDQGSMHIDMMDLSTAKAFQDTIWEIDNIWNMSISGIIRNATASDRNARLEAAIDQGFNQSPYLNQNK